MDSEILSLSDSISPASAQSYKLSHQGCVRLVTYQRDNEICILGCFNMELGSRMMAESGGGVYINEKRLHNTQEALIHTQQHRALMLPKYVFKIRLSYTSVVSYNCSLSRWA